MSMIFSRQCDYALQAVLYLALKPAGRMTPIKELTARLHIPYHFLGKILQRLTRQGLLVSLKGPRGGFALAMPANRITLYRIVEAVDGVGFTGGCVLGFPDCSDEHPCAVHTTWRHLQKDIASMLQHRSAGQLARSMKKTKYRHIVQ